jgi:hypothetical protein
MAYQNAPRPVQPAQYRSPQQQAYQAPRTQAPRQPQSYSPNAPAQRTGLSCLSKLAILVIVLAVAVAIGVTVGRQLAKHHTTSSSGARSLVSQPHRPPASGTGFANRP